MDPQVSSNISIVISKAQMEKPSKIQIRRELHSWKPFQRMFQEKDSADLPIPQCK